MENQMREALRNEQMGADNWRKRRWLTREECRTRTGSPSFRVTKKRLRGRPKKTDHPFDVCEAAEQFCTDCRRATNGDYYDHPKLSVFVDAVMQSKTSEQKGMEEMVFVKTSDGLTKVVFSAVNGMNASSTRKSSVIGEQTHMTPSTDIPIAVPVTGAVEEKPDEKRDIERILASRVISPGHSAYRPTSCMLPLTSLPSQIPVESRVIGENGNVFEYSLPPTSIMDYRHGRMDHSYAPASSLPSLCRPMPLARQGSDAPHDIQYAYIPPYTSNKFGPAVSFRVKNDESPFQRTQAFQKLLGSFPFLDPLMLLSRDVALNGKQPVYPTMRPTRTDCPTLVTGGYFVRSIPESLKEGVQPHVPAMKQSHHCHPRDSTVTLMNILEWIKNESAVSTTRGPMMLKPQNGHV